MAAALLVLWIPVGWIEMTVASSGVSEVWPAAAPPLGLKARLILAGFAALMSIGALALMRHDRVVAGMNHVGWTPVKGAQGARKMGFAFSKLTALARGRGAVSTDAGTPSLRRADAHPDAPPRTPIFASRDFGGLDIFPQSASVHRPSLDERDAQGAPMASDTNCDMPDSPPPFALNSAMPETSFHEPEQVNAIVEDAAKAVPAPTAFALPPTHGLSVAQLVDRLERGLSSRGRHKPVTGARTIADMPVAAAVPVRDRVAPEADDALRAALGTLRKMAGGAR